jgi:hypothetical protein
MRKIKREKITHGTPQLKRNTRNVKITEKENPGKN